MDNIPDLSNFHVTYKLDGHTPVQCDDVADWAEWMVANYEERRVARTTVGDYFVSTIFLGSCIDGSGHQMFETAVFKPDGDLHQVVKSDTWEDAERAHAGAVDVIRHMLGLSDSPEE